MHQAGEGEPLLSPLGPRPGLVYTGAGEVVLAKFWAQPAPSLGLSPFSWKMEGVELNHHTRPFTLESRYGVRVESQVLEGQAWRRTQRALRPMERGLEGVILGPRKTQVTSDLAGPAEGA